MEKVFYTVATIAIVGIASWNFQQNQQEVELSDLALANVEALAQFEGGGSICQQACIFDYNYHCHVFGGPISPTYCFYYRAR